MVQSMEGKTHEVSYYSFHMTLVEDTGLVNWEKSKSAVLDTLFPLEMREVKVLEFIKLQ